MLKDLKLVAQSKAYKVQTNAKKTKTNQTKVLTLTIILYRSTTTKTQATIVHISIKVVLDHV